MHYYKINNEIMQYSTFGNDIALIMHYRALFTMSGCDRKAFTATTVSFLLTHRDAPYQMHLTYTQFS